MEKRQIRQETFDYHEKEAFVVLTGKGWNARDEHLLSHWHEELEVAYVADGHFTHYIEGKRVESKTGSLVVTDPGSVHSFEDNGGVDDLTQMLMDDFLPEHGTKEELESMCVLNHITPQYPPTFFMTATGDFLQEQASLLHGVLIANSIPFVFRFYGDAMRKPLGHVFHCNIKSEDARLCNDEECAFFKEFLK